MYWYLTCVCTFWRVKSNLCIPWSWCLCMHVHDTVMYVCMCVYPQSMYVCMYVSTESMYLCMCVCRNFMYVATLCKWAFLCIPSLIVYFFGAIIFDQNSFCKSNRFCCRRGDERPWALLVDIPSRCKIQVRRQFTRFASCFWIYLYVKTYDSVRRTHRM